MTEGQGPTLKGPQLRRELEKMHIELDMQDTQQIQQEPRDKKPGRATLPNDKALEKTMEQPTTENITRATEPMNPEDRVVSRLDRIANSLRPMAVWQTAVGVGAGAVIGVGVITAGVYFGTRLATRSSAPKPMK